MADVKQELPPYCCVAAQRFRDERDAAIKRAEHYEKLWQENHEHKDRAFTERNVARRRVEVLEGELAAAIKRAEEAERKASFAREDERNYWRAENEKLRAELAEANRRSKERYEAYDTLRVKCGELQAELATVAERQREACGERLRAWGSRMYEAVITTALVSAVPCAKCSKDRDSWEHEPGKHPDRHNFVKSRCVDDPGCDDPPPEHGVNRPGQGKHLQHEAVVMANEAIRRENAAQERQALDGSEDIVGQLGLIVMRSEDKEELARALQRGINEIRILRAELATLRAKESPEAAWARALTYYNGHSVDHGRHPYQSPRRSDMKDLDKEWLEEREAVRREERERVLREIEEVLKWQPADMAYDTVQAAIRRLRKGA